MVCLSLLVQGMTGSQDGYVFSGVALCRAHIMNPAVGMLMVIPMRGWRRLERHTRKLPAPYGSRSSCCHSLAPSRSSRPGASGADGRPVTTWASAGLGGPLPTASFDRAQDFGEQA